MVWSAWRHAAGVDRYVKFIPSRKVARSTEQTTIISADLDASIRQRHSVELLNGIPQLRKEDDLNGWYDR